jgi:hypothetical protein
MEELGASSTTKSSSTTEATLPLRLSADMAAISKPPMRRPSFSDAEAFLLRRGCSKLPCHEVISSPWLGSGPWRRINTGRELPSNWLLILGGDASRTPADSGRDTWGLDCSRFSSSRVVFVKTKVLSSNSRFVRARDARTFVKLYLPRYE